MYGGTEVDLSRALTLTDFRKMREQDEKIACLTAYDATIAAAEDRAGTDLILVGDSLGMVIHGNNTTVPVTTADIAYHCRSVSAGLQRAFMVADMPFLSFATRDMALENAAMLMQQGGAKMVKLEGGEIQADIVRYLTERGVPVCGHIGLQPQLVHKLGGFKVQGREDAAADAMLNDARALEQAGADLLLVECVPADLGEKLRESVSVPVIGIGAGPAVDGQILVVYDMLGLTTGRKPRFVRDFMQSAESIEHALALYVAAVKDGSYPEPDHCF